MLKYKLQKQKETKKNLNFFWFLTFGKFQASQSIFFHRAGGGVNSEFLNRGVKKNGLASESGYAAITTTILALIVSIIVLSAFNFLTLEEVKISRQSTKSIQARYAAEGGVEDAIFRFLTGKQISSEEILTVGNSTTTIKFSSNGQQKIFRTEGRKESLDRNIEAVVNLTAAGVNLIYGAQVGDGGLEMGQGAKVIGGVYSGGDINGANGANITGDAFASVNHKIDDISVGGNANAHTIEESAVTGNANTYNLTNTSVTGNVSADSISNCAITGNAAYNIRANCAVTGRALTPNTPPADPATIPLPISDATISGWKTDASSGGTCAPPDCQANGDYAPTDCSVSLGPKKITGNLILSSNCHNGQTLTVTGSIWVLGHIDILNGANVKLASLYGDKSGFIIADGWINLSNNGTFSGSGTAGSYFMFLSTALGGGDHDSAINLQNNASGAIFYASRGLIYLKNNVAATELVGYKVHLENNAVLTYDIGLQNIKFSSGPKGGVDIKSWKEVE